MSELLKTDYPSIEHAFPIAVASYEQMHKRLDAIDAKNQQITAFAVALFLAVPALFKPSFKGDLFVFFIVAMLMLIVAVIISLSSRYIGMVEILDPQKLYDNSLQLTETEFKRDIIYFAGEAFQNNSALLDRKWQLNLFSNLLLLSGLIMLLIWAAGNRS